MLRDHLDTIEKKSSDENIYFIDPTALQTRFTMWMLTASIY